MSRHGEALPLFKWAQSGDILPVRCLDLTIQNFQDAGMCFMADTCEILWDFCQVGKDGHMVASDFILCSGPWLEEPSCHVRSDCFFPSYNDFRHVQTSSVNTTHAKVKLLRGQMCIFAKKIRPLTQRHCGTSWTSSHQFSKAKPGTCQYVSVQSLARHVIMETAIFVISPFVSRYKRSNRSFMRSCWKGLGNDLSHTFFVKILCLEMKHPGFETLGSQSSLIGRRNLCFGFEDV